MITASSSAYFQLHLPFVTQCGRHSGLLEWRDLGNGSLGALPIEHQPEPVTEVTRPSAAAAPPPEQKKTIGRPIKPITLHEELDDDLPAFLK